MPHSPVLAGPGRRAKGGGYAIYYRNYALPMAVTVGAIILGVSTLAIGVDIGSRNPAVQTEFSTATATVNGKRVIVRHNVTTITQPAGVIMQPGNTRTAYITRAPSPEPGRTVTITATKPGPVVTAIVTEPGPTITRNATITAPGPTVTVTVTAPATP